MNKTQRKEKAEYRAMEIAGQALQCIEAHEKICIDRWRELVIELEKLREVTNTHLAVWKRTSWFVTGIVFATAVLHIILVLT